MRRHFAAWIAAAAVGVALVAIGAASLLGDSGSPDPERRTRLELVSERRVDQRLLELTLRTPALVGETHVRVLLPEGYEDSGRRYPVLYLLHGRGGNYRFWTDKVGVEEIVRDLPLIVVMPDGGFRGWYTNWYNGGAGGAPRWESYHIGELIPWIDSEFRTADGRAGRAIAGASMGGFGALTYAARRPDLFVAAASFSGLVDTTHGRLVRVFERVGGLRGGEPALWGYEARHPRRWRRHNPVELAGQLRRVRVLLFTGNGKPGGPFGGGPDGIEILVHKTNVRLHARLERLDIPHLWNDYGPGAHSIPYFRRDLARALPILMRAFRAPARERPAT